MRRLTASAVCASLIIVSPGLGAYDAAAQVVGLEVKAPMGGPSAAGAGASNLRLQAAGVTLSGRASLSSALPRSSIPRVAPRAAVLPAGSVSLPAQTPALAAPAPSQPDPQAQTEPSPEQAAKITPAEKRKARVARSFKALRELFGAREPEAVSVSIAPALGAPALAPVQASRPSRWSKAKSSFSDVRESLSWVRGFWGRVEGAGIRVKSQLAAAGGLALLTAALSFIPPKIMGHVFENIRLLPAGAGAASGLPWYVALYKVPVLLAFSKLVAAAVAVYAANYFLQKALSARLFSLGNQLMKGLTDLFVAHTVNLPMSWHNTRPVGDVTSTAADAIYQVQKTSTDVIITVIKQGALALGGLAGMLWVSWPLTLCAAPALALILSIPARVYSGRTSRAYKLFFSKRKPKLTSHITQVMQNIETVKASGQHGREIWLASELARKTYIEGGGEIAKVAAPYYAFSSALTDIVQYALILSLVLCVYFGAAGLTVASATFYFFLSSYFRDSVGKLYDTYVQIKQMKGAAAKFDKIMGRPIEDYNEKGLKLPPTERGRAVRFENVSFGYLPGQTVVDGVTLDVKPGELVAFVGESGSGKTTMTRLLLGLYPVGSGRIAVDGHDLKDIDRADFRRRVGTILQDPVPFSGSVAYNISYLKPDVSEAEVWKAAQEAGLHEDIVRLGYQKSLQAPEDEDSEAAPERALIERIRSGMAAAGLRVDPTKSILLNLGGSYDQAVSAARGLALHDDIVRLGYATKVGERGVSLSGGQKQRLLIARLFVNAGQPWDVMILDEPTAALDGVTQRRIQDAVEKRRGRSTVFVVAHRLSTIQTADKIVVFNRGRIVEQGSHEDLLKKGGAYAKLWEAQRLIDEASQTR